MKLLRNRYMLIVYGICALLMLVGTFLDFNISSLVANTESQFGRFFLLFGQFPVMLCGFSASALLLRSIPEEKNEKLIFTALAACGFVGGLIGVKEIVENATGFAMIIFILIEMLIACGLFLFVYMTCDTRNPAKLRAAEELGAIAVNLKECDPCEKVLALTGGAGSDFVIECSGAPGTFVQAVDLAARKGKIALIGFYENKEEVEIDKIVSKELSLIGIMGEYGNMKAVLKLLAEHRPRLEPMITDELALDDCAAGFLRKNYPNAVKIMVKIGG